MKSYITNGFLDLHLPTHFMEKSKKDEIHTQDKF